MGLLAFMPADGLKNQFMDIGQVELFSDAGAIDMNCLKTHIHLLRNLTRAVATPQQLKHLEFAITQGAMAVGWSPVP